MLLQQILLFVLSFVLRCQCSTTITKPINQRQFVAVPPLQMLKNDVNSVGVNLENLAVDLLARIFDGPDPIAEETTTESMQTEQSTTVQEQTTTESGETTEINSNNLYSVVVAAIKPPPSIDQLENSVVRKKRSTGNVNSPLDSMDSRGPQLRQPLSSKESEGCKPKTEREQKLERGHIEDLKEEVNKLRDLVLLLRDQQQIIQMLQDGAKDSGNISDKINANNLLNVLERLNKPAASGKNANHPENDINFNGKPNAIDSGMNQPTHMELEQIKFDLREAIKSLNETKLILSWERQKENRLESELNNQKQELTILKKIMENVLANRTEKPTKISGTSNEIVGTSPLLHQLGKVDLKEKSATNVVNRSSEPMTRESEQQDKPRVRSRESDSSDILRLLELIAKTDRKSTDTTDITAKILELEDQLSKRKKSDQASTQLIVIQRLLQQAEDRNFAASKSLDGDDNRTLLIKRLQRALNQMEKPQQQSKSDDVNTDLRNLQIAINKMRPRDDLNFNLDEEPKNEQEQFQIMLNKLISGQGGAGSGSSTQFAPPNSRPQLTVQQMFELHKQLGQLGPVPPSNGYGSYYNGFGGSGYPAFGDTYGHGTGYVPLFLGGNYQSYAPHPAPNYNSYGLNGPTVNGYNPGASTSGSAGNFGPNYGNPLTPNAYSASQYGAANPKPYDNGGLNTYGGQYAPNPNAFGNQMPQDAKYQVNPGQGSIDYGQANNKNQFFPGSPSNGYDKSPPGSYYAPTTGNGANPGKYPGYPQENPTNANDYSNQKVDDLKTQINGLQNIINNLNRPEYSKKPEDKQTIYNLEKQINDLKNIVNVMNQDGGGYKNDNYQNANNQVLPANYEQGNVGPSAPVQNYDVKSRRKRSADDEDSGNDLEKMSSFLEKYLQLNDDPKDQAGSIKLRSNSDAVDQLKIQLEKYQQNNGGYQQAMPSKQFYQQRAGSDYANLYTSSPNYQYNTPSSVQFIGDVTKSKKVDIFGRIVLKIVDKLLAVTPEVLHKIVGWLFSQLTTTSTDAGYDGYGSGNGIQTVFKNLGVFGFLPMILLRLVDGVTAFLNVLKSNRFLRTFLIPALVLLTVAGSIIFLIWWLQPLDDQYNYSNTNYQPSSMNYGYNTNYNTNQNGYYTTPQYGGAGGYVYGNGNKYYNQPQYRNNNGNIKYVNYNNNKVAKPLISSYSRSYIDM